MDPENIALFIVGIMSLAGCAVVFIWLCRIGAATIKFLRDADHRARTFFMYTSSAALNFVMVLLCGMVCIGAGKAYGNDLLARFGMFAACSQFLYMCLLTALFLTKPRDPITEPAEATAQ